MDREILFRGKQRVPDSYSPRWVYGNLEIKRKRKEVVCRIIPVERPNPREVLLNTVGQYTGLDYEKDRRKMFEGDIFRRGRILYVIKVENINGFRFVVEMINRKGFGTDLLTRTDAEFGEYVGNIHDNPELIKGVEND